MDSPLSKRQRRIEEPKVLDGSHAVGQDDDVVREELRDESECEKVAILVYDRKSKETPGGLEALIRRANVEVLLQENRTKELIRDLKFLVDGNPSCVEFERRELYNRFISLGMRDALAHTETVGAGVFDLATETISLPSGGCISGISHLERLTSERERFELEFPKNHPSQTGSAL